MSSSPGGNHAFCEQPTLAPASLEEAEMLPPVLGEFRLKEHLGSGAMGVVFAAIHEPTGRERALKVLRPRFCADPDMVARFAREAETLAKITHPNVLAVSGFHAPGALGAPAFIEMERLRGRTLADRLASDGPMSPREATALAREVACGVAAVHRQRILHRDLKPSNVFLERLESGAEAVRVVDFGIAKVLNSPSSCQTSSHLLVGTPRYMAPEQLQGTTLDERVDVYQLGHLLYEMLAGRSACPGVTLFEVFGWHARGGVFDLPAGLPAPLAELIASCLARDPDERPSRIEAVEGVLRELLESWPRPHPRFRLVASEVSLSQGRTAPPPAGAPPSPPPTRRRPSPGPAPALVASLLVAAGLGSGRQAGLEPSAIELRPLASAQPAAFHETRVAYSASAEEEPSDASLARAPAPEATPEARSRPAPSVRRPMPRRRRRSIAAIAARDPAREAPSSPSSETAVHEDAGGCTSKPLPLPTAVPSSPSEAPRAPVRPSSALTAEPGVEAIPRSKTKDPF